jgi:hypothetical protein
MRRIPSSMHRKKNVKVASRAQKETKRVLVNANIVAREREMLLCALMPQAR